MFDITRRRRPNLLQTMNLLGNDFDDLSRMFDNMMHFHGASPVSGVSTAGFSPSLDIVDKKDKYLASLELPGLSQEDIDISINEDNVLIIKGEKRVESKNEEDEYWVSECYYGSFRREIPLPRNIVADNVNATFDKGILKLDIPKFVKEEVKPKKIEIKAKDVTSKKK